MSASRIKVIHVCDKFSVAGSSIHGVSRMFSWIFPRFDTSRYDVRLIGLRPVDAGAEALKKQGINIHCLGRGKFDFGTVTDLRRIVKSERPHILHLHGYGAWNFGRLAAVGTPAKCVVHEHFVDPAMPKYQIPFDVLLANRNDTGIAVSRSVKDFMVEKRHVAQEKTKVVYLGAPIEEFQPSGADEIAAQRNRWNAAAGTTVIGFVGRLDTQKGVSYLIDATADLIKKGRKLKLVLVGDGPLTDSLKTQAQERGVVSDVIFAGHSSNVRLLMSAFDIQAFPSLWEGTPLALYEAMAMGRPLVSTGVDGLGEVLRDGETALLVPAKDSRALANGIERLIDDPALAQKLGSGARRDSARFSIQNTVDAMQQIYSELAANGHVG